MALIGKAAMTLWFDIEGLTPADHDHWHTHEHLIERMSIPGFVRGSRWVATDGTPRYFVLYEVDDIGVLSSQAYLDRLNQPSPWTSRVMPHYRAMTRAFCRVTSSVGAGVAYAGLTLRLAPEPGRAAELDAWLSGSLLPALAATPGVSGAHLFESAVAPAMTTEQAMRGKDQDINRALLVTGYAREAIVALPDSLIAPTELLAHGVAAGWQLQVLSLGATLSAAEVAKP